MCTRIGLGMRITVTHLSKNSSTLLRTKYHTRYRPFTVEETALMISSVSWESTESEIE